MANGREPISPERSQLLIIAALAIGMVGLTAVLQASDALLFQRFIGRIHPLIAFPLVGALGVGLLGFLLSRGWFAICRQEGPRWLWRPWALSACLAPIAIVLDLRVVFPAELNVALPASLLFHPAIGFLVEILFHVVPLALLLVVLTVIVRRIEQRQAAVVCILIVSLLEPLFQATSMAASFHFPAWAVIVVGLNVWVFNLLQLFTFLRYDFIAMYSLRLAYYLVWHVVWGHLRLQLLF